MLNLSSANLTAIGSNVPWPVDLVVIALDDTDENKIVRLTNHYHDLTVDTKNYLATGEFLGFTEIANDLEVKDNSLDIQLSGVSSTFTSVMLGESVEGSLVSVFRGYYDESTGELVDAPFLRWSGRVNNFAINDDYNFTEEDAIAITVSCKSLLATMLTKQSGRFTSPQGFEKFNSTDRSMEFVPSLVTFNPKFGKED